MKTTLLAALPLLALAACSAPTSDGAAASSSEVTDASSIEHIAVATASLGAPRCKILQGSFIFFEFQGRTFAGYGADDIVSCQTRIDELTSVTSRPATFTKERTGEKVVWKLAFDNGMSFTADALGDDTNDAEVQATILKSGAVSIDVRRDITNLHCQIIMGSFIQFSYRGHEFQAYGADALDDCETRMAQFRSVVMHQGFLTRSEGVETAKWTLTLDSVWEFTAHQDLETRSDITLDAVDVANVECRHLKGLFLEVTTMGRTWLSLPPNGANTCEGIIKAWNANSRHTGQLVIRNEDGYISRSLELDNRAWDFRAWL